MRFLKGVGTVLLVICEFVWGLTIGFIVGMLAYDVTHRK